MAVVEYEQGMQAFLTAKITEILPDLNADLTAKVRAVSSSPVFTHHIGDIPVADSPAICTYMMSNTPRRSSKNGKIITLMFNVLALIPMAGDNTPMNFEMTRQVAAAHLMTLFDSDDIVQTPKINAGLFGIIPAMDGDRGALVDIWPRKMSNGVTTVRGFEFPYSLSFSLQTR